MQQAVRKNIYFSSHNFPHLEIELCPMSPQHSKPTLMTSNIYHCPNEPALQRCHDFTASIVDLPLERRDDGKVDSSSEGPGN